MTRRLQNRRPRGFSLMEVLIAGALLATMGAMVFGSFKRAYDQKEQVEAADDRYQQARQAMDRMAREISLAFLSEHYDRKRFRERPTIFKGTDRGRQDELLFTSLAHMRMETDAKESDQAVFKYFIDRDPENNRTESLFRRVNPIIDEEADRRGRRLVLAENVKALEFEYWDAAKNEWVEEWDTSRPERNGVLPERVRIALTIVDETGKDRKFTTQTQILMQRSLNF